MASRSTTKRAQAVRADETWQQLIPNRPGVEDLLEAKRIPIAAIDANPEQPRKGPMRGIKELADSILEYGLLEPIVVTPPYSGRYVCLAGHRRLAAYDYLLKQTDESQWAIIPAIERDTPTEDRLVLALLENVSRQDLSDAEKVTSFHLLHDLRGWSQGEIARRLGVSRPLITQYFRVAGDSDVAEHVQTGQIGVAIGYEIVRARTPDAKEAALDAAVHGAPKRVVRQLAQGRAAGANDAAGVPAEDADASGPAPADADRPAGAGRARRTAATAPLDASVRDLAALADQLGLTVELNQLQLFKLMRTLVAEQTTTISLGQFLRLVRADVRKAEALVRAHPQGR